MGRGLNTSMKSVGFVFSLLESSGNRIVTKSISGRTVTPVLQEISRVVKEQEATHGAVTIKAVNFQIDEETISDPEKMESVNTLLTLATEHYTQITQITEEKRTALEANLTKVLSDPKKTKKLLEVMQQRLKELDLPSLEKGDILLVGKFKNRKAEITGFDTDENGQPIAQTTKGDQKIFKPRVQKLMPEKKLSEVVRPNFHPDERLVQQKFQQKQAEKKERERLNNKRLAGDTTKALPPGFHGFDETEAKNVSKYPTQYPEHRSQSKPDKAESPFKTPPKGCTCHKMNTSGPTNTSQFCSTCADQLHKKGLMPKGTAST
jgi:hypothetical protein